jgi:hypothetical protein
LKTRPKQLLGSLPLVITLPVSYNIEGIAEKIYKFRTTVS